MLLDGELDAVFGEKVSRPGLTPLFPDVAAEEQAWFAKRHVLPVNHMVVVSQQLSDEHPGIVREVHRLLDASRQAANLPAGQPESLPVGSEISPSLELITQYAAQQSLIPRQFQVAELFNDVTRVLT
jgi:4,5-dihydroxyphthalate decarboxylase